ncbi:glucose-1-phosphate adenylyltransferase [Terrilactibacillus sp. BCM23-1]|uniref:Glucose-1-phosphate adenylyltransferase n=1 Tax=Terrilactibacillus tamarindi TaxID=2599694 RepID=A0A6N8CQB7_9BACI|nr:glucose-1-phosphate adenylyltransferase [Terrilactibacillus tamarindi]MTT31293.1 glucose-1-phosphate adenylyltransferase [Terrilactibacillus tamarindi]
MTNKKWMAMLLAGGQGTRLGELTNTLAKPAVPFGGKYRIIDFTLSNCMHSGVDTVGVLTQYQPHLLNTYVGNGRPWDLDRKFGGAYVLPPYRGQNGGQWYKGTANAVYQNIKFIDQNDPEYVLVISGDHIYQMDYNKLLEFHMEKQAEATIAVIQVPWHDANRFGIMDTNEQDRITEFHEKPSLPKSNLASMGVYLFNWKSLRRHLIQDDQDPNSSNDFGKDIIPKMLADKSRIYAYRFSDYWKDVGTIESLWEANMDLLKEKPPLNLNDPHWKILTGNANHPPQYISPEAEIRQSLINEGSMVFGKVIRSVISYNVKIGKGCNIKDSVIMPNVTIGENVTIERSIVTSNTVVEAGSTFGTSNPSQNITLISNKESMTSHIREVL